MIKFTVPEEGSFYLIDYIKEKGIPEATAKAELKKGNVKVDGAVTKKNTEVSGSVVEIYPEDKIFEPQPEIAFEDVNLLVLNKQPGVVCESVVAFAAQRMKEAGEYCEEARILPVLCYPLETYMGGLVVIAKNEDVFAEMVAARKERRLDRFCLAITDGCAPDGEYYDYYAPGTQVKMAKKLLKDSVPAVLKLTNIRASRGLSLVSIEKVTNLTDQVCAQMALHEHPVLGDAKYGSKKLNKKHSARYPALWENKIVFHFGKNSFLSYLDRQVVETKSISFPYIKTL